ncbi:MAG: phage tail sheath subtilisin-like domain-containing protein [Deltaproteobacteria bacterium]|jgi:phage tail sheath protein FI
MPQYLSPGVYVEEVPSAVKPIAGVGTSTAGFIGQVADDVEMPPQPGKFVLDSLGEPVLDAEENPTPIPYNVAEEGEPKLITSWEQFKNNFGDFQLGNKTLAHGVYGFFNNGGTRCWVTRLTDDTDADAVTDALNGFNAIDEIALVAVPGTLDANIQGAVIDHCENAGDRFAILDGQRATSFTPAEIQGGVRDSDYAALYFPWINVFDPVSGTNDYVPPSGHMAGVYSRVDTERGVHKAPANEIIRGCVGVESRLSKADQDGLNPSGINVIRAFDGNITVWGARTLGGDANTEWKYINVRRLFLFLRESIDEGTQWVVFEPNTPNLWAKITRNVSAFLTNVWRAGALFGNTPQEAFYVKCDEETNPPEVRDLGQVVTEIGVAVVKPAEFVIFRISQWAGPGS